MRAQLPRARAAQHEAWLLMLAFTLLRRAIALFATPRRHMILFIITPGVMPLMLPFHFSTLFIITPRATPRRALMPDARLKILFSFDAVSRAAARRRARKRFTRAMRDAAAPLALCATRRLLRYAAAIRLLPSPATTEPAGASYASLSPRLCRHCRAATPRHIFTPARATPPPRHFARRAIAFSLSPLFFARAIIYAIRHAC